MKMMLEVFLVEWFFCFCLCFRTGDDFIEIGWIFKLLGWFLWTSVREWKGIRDCFSVQIKKQQFENQGNVSRQNSVFNRKYPSFSNNAVLINIKVGKLSKMVAALSRTSAFILSLHHIHNTGGEGSLIYRG